MLDYSVLPENLQGGMKLYLERGIKPGSFLTACLANDLVGALGSVGPPSGISEWDYVSSVCYFLYNELPGRGRESPWGGTMGIIQEMG